MANKKAQPNSTLLVLREIRDELKEMRAEATKTNERVDALYRHRGLQRWSGRPADRVWHRCHRDRLLGREDDLQSYPP